MKKQHGLTITLASLSAATASIVAGAFVSQHAMASSDTPAEASVTIVASADGGEPIRCTFDDVTLPGAAAVAASADQDGPRLAVAGGAGMQRGEDRDVVASTSAAGAAGAVHVGGEATIVTGAPDGGTIRVLTPEDVREGTPEECAAMRASMPDGLPMPVNPSATTGPDGATPSVAQITGIIGGSGRTARPN